MTDTIEPTTEQRAAAATHVLGVCLPVIDWVNYGIDDGADNLDACIALARLLAEREHKLREEHKADKQRAFGGWLSIFAAVLRAPKDCVDIHEFAARTADNLDAARAELKTEKLVAEKALAARNDMENERDALRVDLQKANDDRARANGYLLAAQQSEMSMKGQLLDARARIVELSQAAGGVNDTLGVLDLCMVVPLVRGLESRIAELEQTTIGRLVVEAEANRASHKSNRMEMQQHIAKITDQKAAAFRRLADMEKREAAHLAHIMALRHLLQVMRATRSVRQNNSLAMLRAAIDKALAATAHYDVEGGEG